MINEASREARIAVRTADRQDRQAVAQALGAAFRDDPVMRWLLSDTVRAPRLFAVLSRFQHGLHGGTDVAVLDGRVVGASLWDAPGYRQSARDFVIGAPRHARVLRARTPRGLLLEHVFHARRPPGRFAYLAALGAERQGQGVGSALLAHRLAQLDGPAYLESSNARNVPLYERFGFRVTGEIHLPLGGPTCWAMLRD